MTASGRLAALEARTPEMLAVLEELAAAETPSCDAGALGRFHGILSAHLSGVAEGIGVLDGPAPVLRAWWGEGPGQVLILCHADTVWPLGEVARRPFRVEDGRAFGPGVLDMKGGIVCVLFALRALREAGFSPKRRVLLLATGDEECGSPHSRGLIEREARASSHVLVCEPAAPGGALKIARRGIARYDLDVTGRAAHAGNDHALGVSAVAELARQVLTLEAMTDYETGVTVNVGVVSGGTSRNTVPEKARALVDVRFATEEAGRRVGEKILSLAPVAPGARLSVTAGPARPPLEKTPANAALFDLARRLAAELGLALTGTDVGGGSDGSFTSALGVATLDGLGPDGAGSHAATEHVVVASLPERAALLSRLIETLAGA